MPIGSFVCPSIRVPPLPEKRKRIREMSVRARKIDLRG
jgi:hypothetical protein